MENVCATPAPPRPGSPFEKIRRVNSTGVEYWSSRDLARVLGYTDYRSFEPVIHKARLACFNSGQRVENHFVEFTELVDIGGGEQRPQKTVFLSRYGCYLIVRNADPARDAVAMGQTYFAMERCRQELAEPRTEDDRRLELRRELSRHNLRLAGIARGSGVLSPVDYAIFQNHGYQGLYDGLTAEDIHSRKHLRPGQQILDFMGSTELAANLFRTTQTEEKLRHDRVKGREAAGRAHYEVGAKVRRTMRELGSTLPENLPAAENIKVVEAKKRMPVAPVPRPRRPRVRARVDRGPSGPERRVAAGRTARPLR